MFPLCSKKFQLMRIGLMRAGCPVELANLEGKSTIRTHRNRKEQS